MSIETRMDVRSLEKFASDLALDTAKQREWAKIMQAFIEETTGELCEKIEYGVDNDGNVVYGNLENDNVDNIFVFGKKQVKIEIKTIPEWCNKFMTFKASSLRSCIRQEARILVPKRSVFYIYTTAMCEELHEKYPHNIYWNHKANSGFSPNDPAVRIYKKDIEKFIAAGRQRVPGSDRQTLPHISIHNWTESCRNLIEDKWSLLSKEKNKLF